MKFNVADFYLQGNNIFHAETDGYRFPFEAGPAISLEDALADIPIGSTGQVFEAVGKFLLLGGEGVKKLKSFDKVLLVHTFAGQLSLPQKHIPNFLPLSPQSVPSLKGFIFDLNHNLRNEGDLDAVLSLPSQFFRLYLLYLVQQFQLIAMQFGELIIFLILNFAVFVNAQQYFPSQLNSLHAESVFFQLVVRPAQR